MSTSTLYIAKRRHPELIGKGGANLRDLQTRFLVKITVPNRDEDSSEVIVTGQPADVEALRHEVEKFLNIKTKTPVTAWKLDIHPDNFKILIGRGGSTLQNLQSKFGVSIHVPRHDDADQLVVIEGHEADLQGVVTEIERLLGSEVQVKSPVLPSPAAGVKSSPSPSPQAAQAKAPVLSTAGSISKVIFFPDKDAAHTPNMHEFLNFLGSAKTSLEICVFTITDDRIASTIIKAHAHGVKIRIITDDDQSAMLGSDIQKFREAGIPVKMDHTPFHMHHKFAVIDQSLLLNGSFNWTRGASQNNCENIMITNNEEFVKAFSHHFEEMWKDTVNFK